MTERAALHYPVIPDPTCAGTFRLACTFCGKSVSSGFMPLPTATPDRGLVIRAVIKCPECLEADGAT